MILSKWKVSAIVFLMLMIAIVASADGPPKLPMTLYGKVNVDGGGDLPSDAKVLAKVGDNIVDEFEVNDDGWYGVPEKSRLIIPECDSFELIIQANGFEQSQGTYTWVSGNVSRVDLTYIPGYVPTPSPTPSPTATPGNTPQAQVRGGGGGGGIFVPPQLPTTPSETPTMEETPSPVKTPSDTLAASVLKTPESTPTAVETAPPEQEEVKTPTVWWQQPTASILFIAIIIGGIALILYFAKR